jgi:RNA polymerase sigma-70 factor (ECF subfamily)
LSSKTVSENRTGQIARARQGDVDAFAAVFEDLRPFMYAVAYRVVGADDAEDVVMEAYLRAWQALPGFAGRSSLRTWLYRIVHNCALDLVRRRQREDARRVPSDGDGPQRVETVSPSDEMGPDEEVASRDMARALSAAMQRLSDEHRVALELRFSEGLSYAEIAAATGVSIGTVMSRLFNAKRKLRRLVERENVP